MTLEGKVALVTGSTSGIGLGIARSLAGAGASIMMNGFGDADEIETLRAQLCEEFGVSVAFDGADLSRRDEVSRLVGETIDVLGGIDVLVNNAGIQFVAPIEEFPEERWEAIIGLNLSAAFYSMKSAIPAMRAKGWGRVINVASARTRGEPVQGCLRRGQARPGRRDESSGTRTRQSGCHRECNLPRMGSHAARRASVT